MNISLEAIKFNHNPASFAGDALNIRRNGTQPVTVPEWRRGFSVNPEDSPAAYAIQETSGNTITIEAQFKMAGRPSGGGVTIRAVEPAERRVLTNRLARPFASLISHCVRWLAGGPLGDVGAREVTFDAAGDSGFVPFTLPNTRLRETGAGVCDITWVWQFRSGDGGDWTDFATSRHRIYTLIAKPGPPWSLGPFDDTNASLPWAEVLDYACSWASGAHTTTQAAILITRGFYQFGLRRAKYDQGIGNYSYPDTFFCGKFLSDLRAPGAVANVNCHDCATIVSTFANALGAELWQSTMDGFDPNKIHLIGEAEPSPPPSITFFTHAVAWEDACDVDNDVFDACFQVDGDDDPTTNDPTGNFSPLIPADLRFGLPTEPFYRFRAVSPKNSPDAARPNPDERTRRPIGVTSVMTLRAPNVRLLDMAAQKVNFSGWEKLKKQEADIFFWRLSPGDIFGAGWELLRAERIETGEGTALLDMLWRPPGEQDKAVVRVDVYEGASFEDAQRWLLESFASFHSFDGLDRGPDDLGNVSFVLGLTGDVFFSRANLVVRLQNSGSESIPLEAAARQIDQAILGWPARDDLAGMYEMQQFRIAEGQHALDEDVELEPEAADPLKGLPVSYKLISDTGVFYARGGKLFYHPESVGDQRVAVVAFSRSGLAFRQDVEFVVT